MLKAKETGMPESEGVPGVPGALPFKERRAGVKPLVFEAAERRKENLEQAGVDVMLEAARAQEGASVLESLRGKVGRIPAQVEMARLQAREEARAEWEEELRLRVEEEREAVVRACRQIGVERERYFSDVEGEVVRLALGIAARVLRREAMLDPMLLSAAVRMALEKVEGESGTVLRVPAAAASAWRDLLADAGDAEVEVLGDERLAVGDCVMETRVGRVELGVAVQLEEIEKGFFDLLQKRPA